MSVQPIRRDAAIPVDVVGGGPDGHRADIREVVERLPATLPSRRRSRGRRPTATTGRAGDGRSPTPCRSPAGPRRGVPAPRPASRSTTRARSPSRWPAPRPRLVLERNRHDHRAEDLLACDAHVVGDVGQHGRFDEEAAGQSGYVGRVATRREPRPVAQRAVDVAEDPVLGALAEMTGPSWVVGSAGSPIRIARGELRRARRRRRRRCSAESSSRLPAMQVWPAPTNPPNAAPRAATSIGVSSKTSTGDLPPSSRVALANRCAVAIAMARPGSVPPVKTTFLTSGCSVSAAPAVGPRPGTTLSTPGGIPASWAISAEQQRGQRRLLRRLEYHRVSGRQRGRKALRGDHHGVVERRQDRRPRRAGTGWCRRGSRRAAAPPSPVGQQQRRVVAVPLGQPGDLRLGLGDAACRCSSSRGRYSSAIRASMPSANRLINRARS